MCSRTANAGYCQRESVSCCDRMLGDHDGHAAMTSERQHGPPFRGVSDRDTMKQLASSCGGRPRRVAMGLSMRASSVVAPTDGAVASECSAAAAGRENRADLGGARDHLLDRRSDCRWATRTFLTRLAALDLPASV